MNTVRTGSVVVLPRGNKLIDVFTGIGWTRHSVFSVEDGRVRPVSGFGLSIDQFKQLKGSL